MIHAICLLTATLWVSIFGSKKLKADDDLNTDIEMGKDRIVVIVHH